MSAYYKTTTGQLIPLGAFKFKGTEGEVIPIGRVLWKDANGELHELFSGGQIKVIGELDLLPAAGYLGRAMTSTHHSFWVYVDTTKRMLACDQARTITDLGNPGMLGTRPGMTTYVEDYAIYGGGDNVGGSYYNVTFAYGPELTKISPTPITYGCYQGACNSRNDNFGIIAGASHKSSSNNNKVYAYNNVLTLITSATLSVARYTASGGRVGEYALVVAGNGGANNAVDAFDSALTRTVAAPVTHPYNSYAVANNDEIVVCARLMAQPATMYNTALTKLTAPAALPWDSSASMSLGVRDKAMFAGSKYINGVWLYDTAYYDEAGTLHIVDDVNIAGTALSSDGKHLYGTDGKKATVVKI